MTYWVDNMDHYNKHLEQKIMICNKRPSGKENITIRGKIHHRL